MSNHNYLYYGSKSTAEEVESFITHVIRVNEKASAEGRKRIPLCVWGRHGIGKTELIEDFARNNGYAFRYVAPAQFEEMGDLLGMPKIAHDQTVFVAPEWVPKEDVPGILLIDDVNRADDRILRGIMQLLQNYELVSWKLPPQWNIILTANPDGGDYSVTPMDDAMITRMMHIRMDFDAKAWAKWAVRAGVDERGINFVLTYPEAVTGSRTTPRTLVQFFDSIKEIGDLSAELPLVQLLADASLDTSTAASFISFVQKNLNEIIEPENILNAVNFQTEVYEVIAETIMKDIFRIDILSVICTRLINHITLKEISPVPKEMKNIQSFLLMDFLPNDLRLAMLQDIISAQKTDLQPVLHNPEIGRLLLEKM
ncbi:MAG: AAA family ATPase [Saprospiraceae bacterium]|nr:AAA family ATPase [Saprospiraceae bacterium]MCB9326846.1 AAA family ATPase [Lewinellaceae bacterium]